MNVINIHEWGKKIPMNGLLVKDELDRINTNFSELDVDMTAKANKAGDTFTGAITIPVGTAEGHAVNKSQLDAKANKAGDTFTGAITIPNGTADGHAVNKSQLDAKANKAGDTFTGAITIPVGTAEGHAVNKSQLDAKANKAGDTFTGAITIPVGTAEGHAVNKSQLDAKANKAGDTFTGAITIPVGTAEGHAVNKSQLDAHVNSTSNPHGVTKTQVGLSNVANALQCINETGIAGLVLRVYTIPNGVHSVSFSSLTSFVAYAGHTIGNSGGIAIFRLTSTSFALSDIGGSALVSDGTAKLFYWASA
ncbi:MAG: hypothetical protein IPL26_23825 [Leptospiraceae bacterium]|nr:hypothetical protein [Leptospiraceae bacterium]